MQRAVAEASIVALLALVVHVVHVVDVDGAALSPGAQAPVYQSRVDLVHLAVTVVDKTGGLVSGLGRDDFRIVEDGVPQTIRVFAAGADEGPSPELHLGLLLDVSESMGDEIAFTKTAAIKFLNTLVDARDVTVVDFDTEVRAARFERDELPRLVERIRLQQARGLTALYDAIGVYLDDAAEQSGRKIMLLYTDGGDTRSSIHFKELLDLLRASDVTVYAIGALGRESIHTRSQQRAVLDQIAEATGGRAFYPRTAAELDRAYDAVLSEIRAQYTIGYLSTNDRADGAWRRVDVSIVPRDGRSYRVRSRRGYFAALKRAERQPAPAP